MKPVIQEEPTGCAIASAAALAGISYATAKKVANSPGITAADPTLWSDTTHIRRLLSHFCIATEDKEMPFTHWQALPNCALLASKWHREKGKPYWHWVVFMRDNRGEYVLDSNRKLKQHVRTDFGRINPKWFIGVTT